MYPDPREFLHSAAAPLGWFYVLAAGVNALALLRAMRRRHWLRAGLWLAFAVLFGVLAARSLAGRPPGLPELFKAAVNATLGPVTFTFGSLAGLVVFYLARQWLVIPAVAFAALNASLVWLGLSMTDPNFAAIVTKPDNVPIVAMVYLLALFTWAGTYQAVQNDRRLARGEGPVEKDYAATVLVWPDGI